MTRVEGPAYDLRAEIYDCFIGDRSDEIAGWAALAAPYGPRIIEWMCGTGEVARKLARAGFDAVGVDIVPEMIAVARRRADEPENPRWVVGDMRTVQLDGGPWDFGLIPAGSLGHLLTRDDQLQALENARRHLRPGGGLSLSALYAPPESRPKTVHGPFESLRPGPDGAAVRKVEVRNSYDAGTRLLSIRDVVEITGGGQRQRLEYAFQVRCFTLEEMTHLLAESGFADVRMYGDFDRAPWQPETGRWIVLADRPE